MTWTVILDKGAKGQRSWLHDDSLSASKRAAALHTLHGGQPQDYKLNTVNRVITIMATSQYDERREFQIG
jgi:hypothetical protein